MTGLIGFSGLVWAQPADGAPEADGTRLPKQVTTHQVLGLAGGALRFDATAGGIRLRDDRNAVLTDVAFIAYQVEGAAVATRPVTFVFNGGPGMASAWLQMGAVGPWRVRVDPATDGPSASPVPVANADTWLDFTDLVFIDPPGTGYSRIVTTDGAARRRLLSVGGDVDVLAQAIRRWLDLSGRGLSPIYILGESYGGFRGPRLARKLESDEGVGVSGLILLSPLLDAHVMSGYADPLTWVDLLPSEVAATRVRHGPVTRADLSDVEAYAAGDYLRDVLRGGDDAAALDRLTERVSGLTGLDPGLVRRMGGRIDRSVFQRKLTPGRVSSAYDGSITRADPERRALESEFPDPLLSGLQAPVTAAMVAIYSGKLNWHPDTVYHLSNDAVFAAWDWGHGMGRPESLSALQAARSVDPHLRVLIAHGMFDLITPYFTTVRTLRLLGRMPGSAPIELRVYPGGHMFYFDDASRAALHSDVRAALRGDAKAVFDSADAHGGSQ
ncbi:S10 family peptidase [Rhodopila sp.]|uniref:S10 family peptidase n=1 Tax=Rhodopila sp. TaxID=2480087 RepID=UPI003D0B62BC